MAPEHFFDLFVSRQVSSSRAPFNDCPFLSSDIIAGTKLLNLADELRKLLLIILRPS